MSMLCTAISRSALELVHTEVVKKVHHQEENGMIDKCSCTVWSRYLLHVPIRYRLVCLFTQSILAGEFRSHFLLSTSTGTISNRPSSGVYTNNDFTNIRKSNTNKLMSGAYIIFVRIKFALFV
ncbi:hypothetical protein V1527DRAFT_468808, partial [Lipomyces starkeyi]